jgi:GT2 family glycosyltransferase
MAASEPTIVVVAYRNTAQFAESLTSLGPGHPLVVVDNGADPEVQRIVGDYGGRYFAPGQNVGFAAAVNVALTQCRGHDVLLLNPDARVSPDLPRLLTTVLHEDSRTAAVAPRLTYASGAPQRVVWPVPSPREAWIDAVKLRRALPPRRVFLIGAVLLLRAEALNDVGGFDERFFLYAEECDWQLRALRRGWRVRLAADIVAVHAASGSSAVEAVRARHARRSAELFARKWYGTRGWVTMQAASLLGTTLRLAFSLHRPSQRARYARELRRWAAD